MSDTAVDVETSGAESNAPTGATPEWLMALPEHYEVKDPNTGDTILRPIRADKTLARYRTLEDAAKGMIEQQRIIGQGINKVPKPDATLEEKRAFWTKIGVPEDVDGYVDVKPPEVDGFNVDPEVLDRAKQIALKNGVLPSQLQEFVNLHVELVAGAKQKMVNGWIAEQDNLQDEWGVSFKTNVAKAQRAFLKYFDRETAEIITAAGLDWHPGMLRGFYRVANELKEHGLIEGGAIGQMDVTSAKAKIDAIRKDKDHPAMNPGNKNHAAATAELEKLYKIAYPER